MENRYASFCGLYIRGVSDVLFLDGRINKGRIMMTVLIILVIHTNAFLKDKFNSLLTDTFAEMNQFGRGTWADGVNSCMPQKY